ncbi:MAG: aspartate kinase, partial [Gemmatimonadota bacterium]
GFQGVSRAREVTTLGRGGSDTTAVALAAALDAERCDIFTDVDGVYTADPAVAPGARRLARIGYDEMTELAVSGARVLHPRAVEIARRHRIPVRVRSSLAGEDDQGTDEGTLITWRKPTMEDPVIIGVASEDAYARLLLRGLPPEMSTMTGVLRRLTATGVSVDLLSQVDGPDGLRVVQLTVRETELEEARSVCDAMVSELAGTGVEVRTGLARVTVVGSGMHKRPGVFARVFEILEEDGVEVHDVSASSVSIIVMVDHEAEARAVRLLHDGFGLGAS